MNSASAPGPFTPLKHNVNRRLARTYSSYARSPNLYHYTKAEPVQWSDKSTHLTIFQETRMIIEFDVINLVYTFVKV